MEQAWMFWDHDGPHMVGLHETVFSKVFFFSQLFQRATELIILWRSCNFEKINHVGDKTKMV